MGKDDIKRLFGKPEKVGFYNSFSPIDKNVPYDFEKSVDSKGRIAALRKDNLFGLQFHVESAMTQNGYQILQQTLNYLALARKETRLGQSG